MNKARARRGMRGWLARSALACGLAWVGLPAIAQAQAQATASEASLKAAYLHKFLPYIEWPAAVLPAPDSLLVIAVAGADAVLSELQPLLAGRHVNGHLVVARRLDEDDTLDGLHAVFIGRGASVPRVLQRLKGRPVLVVTDARQGIEAGAMLNFVPVDGRVRFEAAPAAAERAGLKLGARLLAVAERVVAR